MSENRIGSVIQAVADHALLEAKGLEEESAQLEQRAAEGRKRAQVLRDLHAIAAPHARDTVMQLRTKPEVA